MILLDHQNNYVRSENVKISKCSKCNKNLNILATAWAVYIFFTIILNPIKLFSDLYLPKFLDTLIKLFFPCSD